MNGAGLFFLLLLLLVVLPACSWVGYTRWRAHAHGLPPPPFAAYNPFNRAARRGSAAYPIAPRPGNPLHWVQDQVQTLRSKVSGGRGGASGGDGRRGFDPLDREEGGAWDDRVGGGADADAYGGVGADYEEQELGLRPPPPYGAEDAQRGRSRSRDASVTAYHGARGSEGGYEEFEELEPEGGRANPFGDAAERSELRDASPRPVEDRGRELRRSHFTEAM